MGKPYFPENCGRGRGVGGSDRSAQGNGGGPWHGRDEPTSDQSDGSGGHGHCDKNQACNRNPVLAEIA